MLKIYWDSCALHASLHAKHPHDKSQGCVLNALDTLEVGEKFLRRDEFFLEREEQLGSRLHTHYACHNLLVHGHRIRHILHQACHLPMR